MKKLWLAVGLASLMAVPIAQGAVQVKLADGPGDTGGGEFNATLRDATTQTTLASFITFCLEKQETLSLGVWYGVEFNDGAVLGGADNDDDGDPSKDVIKVGTAYLYSQMLAGKLTGYDHSAEKADQLQNAIWSFEDEIEWDTGNPYLNEDWWDGLNIDPRELNAPGGYGVWVMNLTDSSGNYRQDVLAPVPEPSTIIAGALLLLPFAASSIRRMRKTS